MKKFRLFALAGVLGFTALTSANATGLQIIDTYCWCACPGGGAICVGAINGDCGTACAQAVPRLCPSDM